jgi:hypothetical protein
MDAPDTARPSPSGAALSASLRGLSLREPGMGAQLSVVEEGAGDEVAAPPLRDASAGEDGGGQLDARRGV